MVPIIEDYLSELLHEKLNYLKGNPDHVERILGTNPDRVNRLKSYIGSNKIKVKRGFPRTPAELPCICILLSNEEETQEGLGDYGDSIDLSIKEVTESVQVQSGMVQLSYFPVVSVSTVVNNDLAMPITEHTVLTNKDTGTLEVLDGMAEDEDTLTVTYTYRETVEEQTRVLYEANYRLEVWANNGDLVVELYHLLKWMLISGRDSLIEDREIFRQRLSGADFEPAPNFFPEFVYRRALNFWCQFNVSTPDEQAGFITGVEINQSEYSGTFTGGEDE